MKVTIEDDDSDSHLILITALEGLICDQYRTIMELLKEKRLLEKDLKEEMEKEKK